jgi:hypothetical protein
VRDVNTSDKPNEGGAKDVVGIVASIIDSISCAGPIGALEDHMSKAEEVFIKSLTPMQSALYGAQTRMGAIERGIRGAQTFISGMMFQKSLRTMLDDPSKLLDYMPVDVELEEKYAAEIAGLERLAEKLETNYSIEIGLIQKMADSIKAQKRKAAKT